MLNFSFGEIWTKFANFSNRGTKSVKMGNYGQKLSKRKTLSSKLIKMIIRVEKCKY